jgi:hypothetical protein
MRAGIGEARTMSSNLPGSFIDTVGFMLSPHGPAADAG